VRSKKRGEDWNLEKLWSIRIRKRKIMKERELPNFPGKRGYARGFTLAFLRRYFGCGAEKRISQNSKSFHLEKGRGGKE